jgi:anaerobic selenocysteine-containing dehydrogenase
MQALTGLFARQFGTPNYAAHGGFCSVNMAAGMIYTIGGSFWEFGGPDLDRAKLFVMIGTAEDHHSNPMKIALSKFKRDGGRFISINPVRTGYSAIADEWVPIRPGTDGALLLAIIHEIIATGLYDRDFLVQYTNAGNWSTSTRPATSSACSCAPRCRPKRPATTRRTSCGGTARPTARWSPTPPGADPFLLGASSCPTARR